MVFFTARKKKNNPYISYIHQKALPLHRKTDAAFVVQWIERPSPKGQIRVRFSTEVHLHNILHIRACSISTCLKYRSTTNPKRRFPKQRFRNANTVYFIDTTKRYDKILIILLKVFTLFVHFLAIPHLSDSEFLDSKAEQPAVPCKLHMKLCFTAHYLNQLKDVGEQLKASGSSYMLLQGVDKKVFYELKEELHPFTIEDVLNLNKYCSLNLIKTRRGYEKFVSSLYIEDKK